MFHVGQCKGTPDLQQLYFPAAFSFVCFFLSFFFCLLFFFKLIYLFFSPAAFSLDTLAAGWALSGTGPPGPSLWVGVSPGQRGAGRPAVGVCLDLPSLILGRQEA